MSNNYYVILEFDPQPRMWEVEVEGLPVHTFGPSLAKAKEFAVDALALWLDVDPDSLRDQVFFRAPVLPQSVLDALGLAAVTASQAEAAQAEAAQAKAAAAQMLVGSGLTLRDAGALLGVSYQRIHQLVAP